MATKFVSAATVRKLLLQDRLIDIHCHCLPGLDDGSADMPHAASWRCCRLACGRGRGNFGCNAAPAWALHEQRNSGETVRDGRSRRSKSSFKSRGFRWRYSCGADVRVQENVPELIAAGEVLTRWVISGNGFYWKCPEGSFVNISLLLEPPCGDRDAGGHHASRNDTPGAMRRSAPVVRCSAKTHGALLQITAGSLLGTFGEGGRSNSRGSAAGKRACGCDREY